ncbi:MAG: RNA signal recognition particle [candidate division Zixibacteria bacterium RBG_16_50_21]|nr:MAG: RNA signal recognition particle [candidate division Zixibacteria bacterium RBG_16_50_21]
MSYVDGFVLPVPKKNLAAYRKLAREAGKIWRKYGAIDYKECIGDDLKNHWGGIPFNKLARTRPGETVAFSYIVYKSRAHRDQVNASAAKDPFMNDPKYKDKPMPFDMKRQAYGGFKVIVDA